jgi:hypothetical protein
VAVKPSGALRTVARIVSDENLDLYVLTIAALAFTLLGFVGTVSLTILTSGILGLLALLAISQVRSRRQVSVIASAQRADPLALFKTAFPDDLAARRSAASSFMFIGESMIRVVHDARTDIKRILAGGGKVRVLLLDPDDPALMRVADRMGEQLLENRNLLATRVSVFLVAQSILIAVAASLANTLTSLSRSSNSALRSEMFGLTAALAITGLSLTVISWYIFTLNFDNIGGTMERLRADPLFVKLMLDRSKKRNSHWYFRTVFRKKGMNWIVG